MEIFHEKALESDLLQRYVCHKIIINNEKEYMPIRNDVVISKNPRSQANPWTVRWWGKYDVDKEKQPRLSKSFATKKQAERYAEKIRTPEARTYLENGKLTLEQLCNRYLAAYKSTLKYSSYSAYKETTKRIQGYFAPYCHISSINKEEAITFINGIINAKNGEKASDSTRSRHLRQCKRLFRVAQEWGYICKNPFEGIKLGKINKKNWYALTMEQFGKILHAVDSCTQVTKKNEAAAKMRMMRLKAFYSVMYYCGLRFGEAANLLWDNDDIDFEENQINIANRSPQKDIPVFSIKDHENRSIPVPQKVIEMLKELKEKSKPGNPFVFLSAESHGRLVKRWHTYCEEGEENWDSRYVIINARRDFKHFCEKAGLKTSKVLTLHSLRKGYGTNMANLGIPPHTLKDLMGHSSSVTTMEYYVKTLDENKKSAAEKLNDIAVT